MALLEMSSDTALETKNVHNATSGHKLWGGRFAVPTADALDALNRSIGVDYRLWPFDLRLSRAWAAALRDAGVLTADETSTLQTGLDAVGEKLATGAQPEPADEDVHTMNDRMLHAECGEVASKLHTGRSRNDQVATATRLWAMHSAAHLDEAVCTLQSAILRQAESATTLLMPAYTHLQRAQPICAAHWLLSHFWPLERDRDRIAAAARSASVLPLGSGAIAGCAYPVSRESLQASLGFSALSRNSIDAVGDRDFVADMLYAVTMLGVHLSRLAEDLIMYGSSEFGFVHFGESYTTGSSMMPQKRNPDGLELARASCGRALGDLTALVTTIKGLPSGYNKDLQDDKRALFGSVDAMLLVLPAVAGTVAELTLDAERMRAALSSSMMATDLADYLVARGVSFREAHGVVGSLVREAERSDTELTMLPFRSFTAAHHAFGHDVFDWLSASGSVARREVAGATGPEAVRAQIRAARVAIDSRSGPRGNRGGDWPAPDARGARSSG